MGSARMLGARYHESIADDLEVFYTQDLIRRVTALVRTVKPDIVLTQSLEDYMEDHMNTGRIAVTATFLRGVPNYRSVPDEPAIAPGRGALPRHAAHPLRPDAQAHRARDIRGHLRRDR